ncbi:achaete-scute homolog 4-like [Littorina saxatilis]|uniref:BHLH domain-containing protein n=1 Tax=Littorina saxatilis TaxID=31220 RepID=A0AAN9GHH5_9CAEN
MMDMRDSRYVSCGGFVHLHPVKMTSPTCEDLGIPTDLGMGEEAGGVYPLLTRRIIHNPSLHLDGLRYEAETHKISDPYSPLCMIPLPGALALHTTTEPSFIRKRNERERERVRGVNDGYERLKDHLPFGGKEKRISKVETLRAAIDYIKQLQELLDETPPSVSNDRKDDTDDDNDKTKSSTHKVKATTKYAPENQRSHPKNKRNEKRRGSLSSEQSVLSDVSESDDELFVKKQRIH